ncbi:MarR family transcriptional regulator [Streptomyces sp. NPDC048710]
MFHGHATTKAVAQHMVVDPGAVSRLVDRLVAKDLIALVDTELSLLENQE